MQRQPRLVEKRCQYGGVCSKYTVLDFFTDVPVIIMDDICVQSIKPFSDKKTERDRKTGREGQANIQTHREYEIRDRETERGTEKENTERGGEMEWGRSERKKSVRKGGHSMQR
ncbi:hypothetical protein ElyMa_002203100 [Elysia marginata]|uniref:Uncharacterized protein n=1 Tax=Elysia marginata TaxID=1093978 RepID=A0AAV4FRV8_9GAST|nr:hypothetical protein ElyMa_002203100 [Elysia marginata]